MDYLLNTLQVLFSSVLLPPVCTHTCIHIFTSHIPALKLREWDLLCIHIDLSAQVFESCFREDCIVLKNCGFLFFNLNLL
jgi:hypothetical protein